MDQRNMRFIPHAVAIQVGTIVDFPNSDRLAHNVFSISKTKRFNLGLYPAGHTRSLRFDKPGVVEVLCDVHLEMSAYIVVLENPYFALTGTDGKYEIQDVPVGSRTVWCWSAKGRRERKDVSVQADRTVIANFLDRQRSFLWRPQPPTSHTGKAETARLAMTHNSDGLRMSVGAKDD